MLKGENNFQINFIFKPKKGKNLKKHSEILSLSAYQLSNFPPFLVALYFVLNPVRIYCAQNGDAV